MSTSRASATPTCERRTDLEHIARTYGRARVAPDERAARIRAIFAGIAPGYDRANDLMSLGLHRRWKNRLAAVAAGGGSALDLAGGTGDVAQRLRRDGRLVLNGDPSLAMLAVDRRRHGRVPAVAMTAEALPLESASVATVTLAFGLRNFTDPGRALGEIVRVLRPGGRLCLLEFSRPAPWLRPFYRALNAVVLPLVGGLVTARPGAYRYLAQSIDRFPDADAVSRALAAAGLRVLAVERFACGIAALHVAERPHEDAAWTR